MAENLIFGLILVPPPPPNIFAGFASNRYYTLLQVLTVYNFTETNQPT